MSFLMFLALAPVVGAFASISADWSLGADNALHWSHENMFYAMSSTGSVKWTFDAKSPIQTYTEGLNGTIHIIAQPTSGNSTHYALNGMDGSIQWQRTALDTNCTGHKQAPDGMEAVRFLNSGSILYLVCQCSASSGIPNDSGITAIEAIDLAGERKWMVSIRQAISVDIGPEGGVLVQVTELTGEVSVSLLQREDGTVRWTLEMDIVHGLTFGGWALSNGDVFVVNYKNLNTSAVNLELLHLSGEDGSILANVSHALGFLNSKFTPGLRENWPTSGCNREVYVTGPDELLVFDFNSNLTRTMFFPSPTFSRKQATRRREDGTEEDIFVAIASRDFDSFVSAHSGTTGERFWVMPIAGQPGTQQLGNLGLDGTVFVITQSDMLAIRNGTEDWRGSEVRDMLVAKDGTKYLQQGHYHSLDISIVALDANYNWEWSCPITGPTLGAAFDSQSSFVV